MSLYPSNFDQVRFEYKALAPNWKILEKLENKTINEDNFIVAYKEQLNELDPKNVLKHLNSLTGGHEPIIMCQCGKTKFCHRHLIADWLESELGIYIHEYNFPDHVRKNGYLIKRNEPSLFSDEDQKVKK
ncbi:MAG: DUF488 family protein [Bacteroidetes bacterium]|nr:DUF488 family protein [Bacteroidota bacterium]